MQKYPRVIGLGLLILSSFLGKFFMYDVYQEALAGNDNISFSMKMVVFSVMFAAMGTLMMVLGQTYNDITLVPGTSKQLTPIGWAITLLLVGLGFWAGWIFQGQLEGLGYQF